MGREHIPGKAEVAGAEQGKKSAQKNPLTKEPRGGLKNIPAQETQKEEER